MNSTKLRRGKSLARRRENIAGWLFIGLNFLGYIAFKLAPLVFAGVLSFTKWNFTSGMKNIKWVGLKNYMDMFKDEAFLTSLMNTIVYSLIMVPVAIFLALIFAVILDKYVYGKGVLRLAFYLPYISSMIAVSLVWMILFLPTNGPVNQILTSLGVENPPRWFNGSSTSLLSMAIVGVWQRLGYNIIIVLAGLQGISASLYEASDIDGANVVQKFLYITIPSLSSTLFFLTMISFINSFQVFTPVKVITQGGPGYSSSVLVYYIYQKAFQYSELGYASALSWVLFDLVFVFSFSRMIVDYMGSVKQRKGGTK